MHLYFVLVLLLILIIVILNKTADIIVTDTFLTSE